MPHKDGPAYYPLVAILSLESPISIAFFRNLADSKIPGREVFSLFLQPRSLFVFMDDCYQDLFHCIAEVWNGNYCSSIHDWIMHHADLALP
jgi:alkylated DNA repair protein alkB family protein 6